MFKFNNISSDIMKVVVEEEESFLGKAEKRYEVIEIEGKDGAIYNELGYAMIDRPIKLQILDVSKLDEIFAWLDGKGILEYKNRITNAIFSSVIDPQRVSTIKVAEFNFIREPFWYKKNDDFISVLDTVYNEGNVKSRPIIRIEKQIESNVDITINNIRFLYTFENDEEYVEIDCENMIATYENLIRNRNLEIGFEFPSLDVGENIVTLNSGDSIIKFKRKDRWL